MENAKAPSFPSSEAMNAFFEAMDKIERLPDSEDTDEGMAWFLDHAGEDPDVEMSDAEREFATPEDTLDDDLLALAETREARERRLLDEALLELATPLPRTHRKRGKQRGPSTRSATTLQPSAPSQEPQQTIVPVSIPAATPREPPAPSLALSSKSTRGPEPKPTYQDHFSLPFAKYAEWLQDNYSTLLHKNLFICQSLHGERVFLAAWPDSTQKLAKERLIVIKRLGGTISAHFDPARVTVVVTQSSFHEWNLVGLLHVNRISDVPSHIKIYDWEWVAECMHAVTSDVPSQCPRHVLFANRHHPDNAVQQDENNTHQKSTIFIERDSEREGLLVQPNGHGRAPEPIRARVRFRLEGPSTQGALSSTADPLGLSYERAYELAAAAAESEEDHSYLS